MVLALDIGGTHIRSAIVRDGRVSKKEVIFTPKKSEEILEALDSLLKKYAYKKIICVGIAGYVMGGKVIKAPNLGLNDFDMKKWLVGRYKCTAYVENDAKCAGISELKYGIAKKYRNFVYLTIGTGIGGAIFVNRKLYRGNGFAGEFGHMILNGGDFESNASGKALGNLVKEIGIAKSSEEISKLAEKESPLALKIFDIVSENLSSGILNIIHSLDPEAIILGGGFSEISFLPDKLKIAVKSKDILKRELDFVNSGLGADGVLIGASLLQRVRF